MVNVVRAPSVLKTTGEAQVVLPTVAAYKTTVVPLRVSQSASSPSPAVASLTSPTPVRITPTVATPVVTSAEASSTPSVPPASAAVAAVPTAAPVRTTPTVATLAGTAADAASTPSVPHASVAAAVAAAPTAAPVRTTPTVATPAGTSADAALRTSVPHASAAAAVAAAPTAAPVRTTPTAATLAGTAADAASIPSVPHASVAAAVAAAPTAAPVRTTPTVATPAGTSADTASRTSVPHASAAAAVAAAPTAAPVRTTTTVATLAGTAVDAASTPSVPHASAAAAAAPTAAPVSTTPTDATPVGASADAASTPSVPPASAAPFAPSPASMVQASLAAGARQRVANGASVATLLHKRLSLYASAVKGGRVLDNAVEDLASVISAASRVEDIHPELRLVVHLSGVSASGELGWASLFGDHAYVDPDVLRVFGQAHQFCRARDVLQRTSLFASCPSATLVGTCHRGGVQPSAAAPLPPSPTAADLEMLHAMVAPQLDDINPPPLDIQRLARLAARAEEASRSPSPLLDQLPLTDGGAMPAAGASSGGGPADDGGGGHSNWEGQGDGRTDQRRATRLLEGLNVPGVVPFVLETLSPPKPHKPTISAFRFMATIMLNRRAPITLLRAVLRAAMLFFAMRFGQGMRSIHEGFARWWARQLLLEQTESGELQEKTGWPLGVAVPVEFLPAKTSKELPRFRDQVEQSDNNSTQRTDGGTDDLNNGEQLEEGGADKVTAAFNPAVVVTIKVIPTDTSHSKQQDVVAAILLLWDKEKSSRTIMQAEVFKADKARSSNAASKRNQQARRKPTSSDGASSTSGAPALAPRGGVPSGIGAGQVDGRGGGSTSVLPTVVSDAAAARSAARAAAAGGAAATKRAIDSTAAAGPAKRARRARARGGQGVGSGQGQGAGDKPPSAGDGPVDLAGANGLTVATGIAEYGRRVLHTREVPANMVVVQVTAVQPSGADNPYPFEQDFPVEPPAVSHRSMGETVGTYIVWSSDSVFPC